MNAFPRLPQRILIAAADLKDRFCGTVPHELDATDDTADGASPFKIMTNLASTARGLSSHTERET